MFDHLSNSPEKDACDGVTCMFRSGKSNCINMKPRKFKQISIFDSTFSQEVLNSAKLTDVKGCVHNESITEDQGRVNATFRPLGPNFNSLLLCCTCITIRV